MLFDIGDSVVESEKERNLYAKFFAGYFFNELVPGADKRLDGFANLIQEKARKFGIETDLVISYETAHACFDIHAYLLGGKNQLGEEDRGEIADILLHDRKNKVLISIEAKFLGDFEVNKDAQMNLARLGKLREKMPDTKVIFCLLLARTKWERVEKYAKRPGSQFTKLINGYRGRLVVLLWEELIELCENERVRIFMRNQIRLVKIPRKSVRYSFRDYQPIREVPVGYLGAPSEQV